MKIGSFTRTGLPAAVSATCSALQTRISPQTIYPSRGLAVNRDTRRDIVESTVKEHSWIAQNRGHSVAAMLNVYAKWMTDSTDKDVVMIGAVMGFATSGHWDCLN
jgi:hypothetical protein